MPSSTLNKTSLRLKVNIHTLLKTVHAHTTNQKDKLEFPATMMSLQMTPTNSWQLLLKAQSQSPLKLINQSSNHTTMESSLTLHAEPTLTMVSS